MMKNNASLGWVSLVGAGPGDPGLLTLHALQRIQNAEVLVYDRLVSDAILALAPSGVMRVFAGKSCKHKAMTQQEINDILVMFARKGKRVVRLKGGDPFLFGRGGEEAEYLHKQGIAFDIVPGITSAQGCAAYAGIPLTHRGLATGVRYVTGHAMAESEGEPLALDWAGLADADTTLVVYMGLSQLEKVTEQLMAHGLSPDTPAAAIERGTQADQRVIVSTLASLGAAIDSARLSPPTLLVIGKVVSLAHTLSWFNPTEKDETIPFRYSS